jgi:hypothetical protein
VTVEAKPTKPQLPAVVTEGDRADLVERVIVKGDLAALTPPQRVAYYRMVCESAGLNPLTRPFEYLQLDGKLVLYARKDCTEQLRKLHNVSVKHEAAGFDDGKGIYTSSVVAYLPPDRQGYQRQDTGVGSVSIIDKRTGELLKGVELANAVMRAETKAKRRATLAICGLGCLDETELETIPSAKVVDSQVVESAEQLPAQTDERRQLLTRLLDELAVRHIDPEPIRKYFGVTAMSFLTVPQIKKALSFLEAGKPLPLEVVKNA